MTELWEKSKQIFNTELLSNTKICYFLTYCHYISMDQKSIPRGVLESSPVVWISYPPLTARSTKKRIYWANNEISHFKRTLILLKRISNIISVLFCIRITIYDINIYLWHQYLSVKRRWLYNRFRAVFLYFILDY